MRKLKDKAGYEVSILSISGSDDFSGLLEGSPYMVRKMRCIKAKRALEQNKHVHHEGLKELQDEIENMDRNTDIWPARESWIARIGTSSYLGSEGDFYKYENKEMRVHWYQEGGDPMEKLKLAVSNLDFLSSCKTSITEECD